MSTAITHVVVGPAEHGVVRHALDLLAQPALAGHRTRRLADADGLRRDRPGRHHLHLTDHLFGTSPEAAAERVEQIAAGGPLSLTLHDLPDPTDARTLGGPGPRDRAAAYRRMAAAADLVVVASQHEAGLLRALDRPDRRVEVLPLPRRRPQPAPRPASRPQVALLGFLHPGKGLETLLDAVADLPPEAELANLGPVARGHDDYAAELRRRAERRGRRLRITGWLSDDDLLDEARRTAVPVMAHQHVSASGSLGAWWQAGRRPVATRTPYLAEIVTAWPGTAVVTDDLAAALHRAWSDPDGTWLAPGTPVGPSPAEIAARLAALLEAADEH